VVNGPDQYKVAQLCARGLLVQDHLDSVETIECSARCKAISILPSSRFEHKRRRHVGCITTSRNAAVLGSCISVFESLEESPGVRGHCVAPPNRYAATSRFGIAESGTRYETHLCNHLTRLLQSLVVIRSMSERETDQRLHNSLAQYLFRQPMASSGAAVGAREGPARIDRRPKARSDRRRPRVNCKANLSTVVERAKVTRIASR